MYCYLVNLFNILGELFFFKIYKIEIIKIIINGY